MNDSVLCVRNIVAGMLLGGLAVCGFGCGAQTYEQRLAATTAYFEYREKVDQALEQRPWSNFGIDFRAPKGFVEIGAPAEGEADPRQPPALGRPLPGLLAVWRADVKVEIPNSEVKTMPAWVLVCSNHQDWLARATDANVLPMNFHANLADSLADNRNVSRNLATAPWKFEEQRVPKGTPYVPIKSYDYYMFGDAVDGVAHDFALFRYNAKDIQFGLIVVTPQPISRSERLFEKIAMGMEQLAVSSELPRAQTKKEKVSGGGF